MDDALNKKRFLWGALLAWSPWVPMMIGFVYAFIGISSSKATGLVAVAGGMVEMLVLWGLAALFISQAVAIIWLIRSFSGTQVLRNLVAAASIFASGLTLFMVCAILYWSRHLAAR